jgi:hypothetical protein
MRSVDLLQRQLAFVNSIFHILVDDLTDEEMHMRVLPQTNLIAFDLWHVARSQDWAVQTLARGVPEVVHEQRWRDKGTLATRGIGVGLTHEQADALAHGLKRDDIIAYADAVHAEVLAWLSSIDDDALDSHPDVLAHYAAFPEYQTPEMRDATPWAFAEPPLWRCLIGPPLAHVRDHLAEIELLRQQLRLR